MSVRELIILAVFIIFVVPSMISIAFWSQDVSKNPTPENMEKGIMLLAGEAIPWWFDIFMGIVGISFVGGILGFGFIWFLQEYRLL